MRRLMGAGILAVSVLAGVCLIWLSENSVRYTECIVEQQEFEKITAERVQTAGLADALIFDDEVLFFDGLSRTFYYSLVEGNESAYDPKVELIGRGGNLEIAFLSDEITPEMIENNQAVAFLTYTEEEYSTYYLKCTTLPVMHIACEGIPTADEIGVDDPPRPMNMTVFDNRRGAVSRMTVSEGEINVRGASSKYYYPKKGYKISLTQKSAGDHLRANDVSLLGMRQDNDWILYGAYNDQEKIRNVYSSNLWQYSCAEDNEYGVNTGAEYKYLELFVNGEYRGLYALGYSIDKKQLQLDVEGGREALYKVSNWVDSSTVYYGNLEGYEVKGMGEREDNWSPLSDYFSKLYLEPADNEGLYQGIDIDNAIDIYLFFNLIQGIDNVSGKLTYNMFVAMKGNEQGGITALYCPWDMDRSWGNDQDLYDMAPDRNCIMESGYLNQLMLNGDDAVWEKIFDKYRKLRSTVWSEESLNAMIDEYEADIFDSGAFLRDKERWPEGAYADPTDKLDVFRDYVMERLRETDDYYERMEKLCDNGIFVRRSVQYKDFLGRRFIVEINDRSLLEDWDYRNLLEYMGIDIDSITGDVHYIIADPRGGKADYLPSLVGDGRERKTAAGTFSFEVRREGVYKVYLDGMSCGDSTIFSKPGIKMLMIKDDTVETFNFDKEYAVLPGADIFPELSTYVEAMAVTGYDAIIEVSDTDIWEDPVYRKLFEKLGIEEKDIDERTDFIVWNGRDKKGAALCDLRRSGGERNTPIGELSLTGEEDGAYMIYLDGEECFVSELWEREEMKVRTVLMDPDSHEILEGWKY